MEKVFMYRGVRYGPGFQTPNEELKRKLGLAPRVQEEPAPDPDSEPGENDTGSEATDEVGGVLGTSAENTSGLPEDFPAAHLLEAEGFSTVEEVAEATDEELLELEGIGQGTLKKIREYLAESEIE